MTVNKDEIRRLDAEKLIDWLEQEPPQYKIIPRIKSGAFDAPPDANEETIRQQAEEIERLTAELNDADAELAEVEEARKAAERERDELLLRFNLALTERDGARRAAKEYRFENEQFAKQNAALCECLAKVMRVTADGSCPDEWNGSTGGAGHAEIRKIVGRLLAELDRKDTQPTSLMRFPRQPNKEGGWTVLPNYLERIGKHIEGWPDILIHDEIPSWEQIEMVLLAVEDTQPKEGER